MRSLGHCSFGVCNSVYREAKVRSHRRLHNQPLLYHDSTVTYRHGTRLTKAFTFASIIRHTTRIRIRLQTPTLTCQAPNTPTRRPRRCLPTTIGLAFATAIVQAPRLTPGLAARSSVSGDLFKKFGDASCRDVLGSLPSIGDVGAPAHLSSVLLPSISAKARSTVASEYDDAPCSERCGCVCGSAEDTARFAVGAFSS